MIASACLVGTIATGCTDSSLPSDSGHASGEPGATDRDPSLGQTPSESENARLLNPEEARFRGEFARIRRAPPEPTKAGSPAERLKRAKKVRHPAGGWYYISPGKRQPAATPPVQGCVKRAPQPPGVTARRIDPAELLVTYRMGRGDAECRASWIVLTVDVSDDPLSGEGWRLPIAAERKGQIVVPLSGRVVDADILVASARTKRYAGFASRTTTVRIR